MILQQTDVVECKWVWNVHGQREESTMVNNLDMRHEIIQVWAAPHACIHSSSHHLAICVERRMASGAVVCRTCCNTLPWQGIHARMRTGEVDAGLCLSP